MGAAGQQACSWEARGGELECGVAFYAAREVEQAGSSDKGLRKERGYVGESAYAGLLRQSLNSMPLTIENTLRIAALYAAAMRVL